MNENSEEIDIENFESPQSFPKWQPNKPKEDLTIIKNPTIRKKNPNRKRRRLVYRPDREFIIKTSGIKNNAGKTTQRKKTKKKKKVDKTRKIKIETNIKFRYRKARTQKGGRRRNRKHRLKKLTPMGSIILRRIRKTKNR